MLGKKNLLYIKKKDRILLLLACHLHEMLLDTHLINVFFKTTITKEKPAYYYLLDFNEQQNLWYV